MAGQFTSYGLTKGDANAFFNTGVYTLHYNKGSITNIPSELGSTPIGSLHVVKSVSSDTMFNVEQTIHDLRTSAVYYRSGYIYKGESVATFDHQWQRLDNFGYNTLEELAAALQPYLS